MNDFLTALAARTLGAVPVVTPRRPSPFESTDAVALAGHADLSGAPDRPSVSWEEDAPGAAPAPVRAKQPLVFQAADDPAIMSHAKTAVGARPAEPVKVANVAPASTEARIATGREARDPDARAPAGRDRPASESRVIPQPMSRRAPEASLPRERAAPAIHVTIGRVEVRAVQRAEPGPAARKHAETPRLSLGAYLRGDRR